MSALAAEPTFRALVADREPVPAPRTPSRRERRAAQRAARRAVLRAAREAVRTTPGRVTGRPPRVRSAGPLARGAAVAVTAGMLVGGGLGASGAAGQAPGYTGVAGAIAPFSAERGTSAHGARLAAQADAAARVSRAESLAVATAALQAAAAVGPLTAQMATPDLPAELRVAVDELARLVHAGRPPGGSRMRAEVPLPPAQPATAPTTPATVTAPDSAPVPAPDGAPLPDGDHAAEPGTTPGADAAPGAGTAPQPDAAPEPDGAPEPDAASTDAVVELVRDAAATDALRDALADVAAADEALADNPLAAVPTTDDSVADPSADDPPADDPYADEPVDPGTGAGSAADLPATAPTVTDPTVTDPPVTGLATAEPPPADDPAGDLAAEGDVAAAVDPAGTLVEPGTAPDAVDPGATPWQLTAALAEAAGRVFRLSMEVEALSGSAELDESVARGAALADLEGTVTTADEVTAGVAALAPLEPLSEEEKRARAALEEAATARREDVHDAGDPVTTTVRSRARLRSDVPAGVTALTQRYQNGRIPAEELCAVEFAPQHRLQCDAAAALVRLNAAHRRELGTDLVLVSSYRTFDVQVTLKATKGGLAATPGTSNHGWGLAVDLGGIGGLGDFDEPGYLWLQEHAGEFGWHHPRVMEPGGSGPQEPWHWEFGTA